MDPQRLSDHAEGSLEQEEAKPLAPRTELDRVPGPTSQTPGHEPSLETRAPAIPDPPLPHTPATRSESNVARDTEYQLLRAPPDENNWPAGDKVTAATYTLNQVQFSGPKTPPRSSGNRVICSSHDSHGGISKTSLILSK